MQRVILVICLCLSLHALAQPGEFGQSENGLIYTPGTIQQLKYIVDSLNLKFKVCEADPKYSSLSQATGNYISMSGPACDNAKKDLEANIPLMEFVEKYKMVIVYKNLTVIRSRYKNYKEKEFIYFNGLSIRTDNEVYIEFENNFSYYEGPLAGKWLINYQHGGKDYDAYLEAIFIVRDFQQQSIPQTYARWIQYSDCLVDTSTQVFTAKAIEQGYRSEEKPMPYRKQFLELARRSEKNLAKPTTNDEHEQLKAFALKAFTEAKENNISNDELESYLTKEGFGKEALELKRSRIVVGQCSQDDSPRIHALNIATLAAETISWEVFLRAHLDIMNDNFNRVSDGSYAWGRRQTYLRELEVLDINVPDLLLGICFRISNPSSNHYPGSISRIGRALAEYSQPQEIEDRMFAMISDKNLDAYNRILSYYLFLNYNNYVQDKQKKAENSKKLRLLIQENPITIDN